MTSYDSIIFDLDGTLCNVSVALAKGWTATFQKHRLINHTISANTVKDFLEMPFKKFISKILPDRSISNDSEILKALVENEKRFVEAEGGYIYNGVANGIVVLAANYKLFIVSNCQDWYLDSFW